jgi:hypothetical protein
VHIRKSMNSILIGALPYSRRSCPPSRELADHREPCSSSSTGPSSPGCGQGKLGHRGTHRLPEEISEAGSYGLLSPNPPA